MSEHAWFHEQLPLYLTAGLDAASVERLRRHAAECADCGHELASMESLDRTLLDVFADIRPDAALESKLIDGLRNIDTSPAVPSFIANREPPGFKPQPKKRPWLRILGIAASVVLLFALGGLGAVLSNLLDDEGQPLVAQNKLRQLGLMFFDDSQSMDGKSKESKRLSSMARGNNGGIVVLSDGVEVWEDRERAKWKESSSFLAMDINPAATEFDTDINYNVDRHGDVSVPLTLYRNRNGERGVSQPMNIPLGSLSDGSALTAQIRPEVLNEEVGKSYSMDGDAIADRPPNAIALSSRGEKKESFGLTLGLEPAWNMSPEADEHFESAPLGKEEKRMRARQDPKSETYSRQPGKPDDHKVGKKVRPRNTAVLAVKVFDDFFAQTPEKKPGQKPGSSDGPADNLSVADPKNRPLGEAPAVVANQDDTKQKGATEVKGPTGSETRRVVIRSGDIEFEVDSFDDAAAIVTRLTNATKGGFVATTNSRKRENGKMEGTVVVRVPPTELDGLVEALRKALAKAGELKGQNIGSQDVTKQYVDTESALRANRITEERLLRVIKEGKGEIKDLVIAEEKLGKVRVEIERMEGELRYYANLAALSTLSVKLTEKDIQVAAKLIENATVKASIEVEDVEKARQEVQKAIADLKGRVIKSESKQQSTGEFNVALEFETPAEATDAMRDRLRKLGTAAMLDTDVAQRTEGGATTPKDVKPEKGPTTFRVALVNFGQLQARDVLRLALAVRDVIDSHRKLRDAVLDAKGAVRLSSVDEKDRQNVTARLEFDVPVAETKRINELLAGLGERLSVATERRPEGERATEQRTSFKVDLSPASRIEPRETHALALEVRDVEATLEILEGQVKGAGGRITVPSQRNQESNGRVTAVVVYDVPLAESEKMLKRIKSVGQVRIQRAKHNPTAPDGPLALARFELTLSNQELLVPRDQGAGIQIRQGFQIALRGLSLSLGWLIVAVLFVGPWVLLIYGIVRLVRRMRRPATPTAQQASSR
ncbi:MAG: DUF4349 domain-containing protein, partial [Gemmataceae bacterium]|nr:DUF4349 domain-containing protein [Gemmataceae bacterium]